MRISFWVRIKGIPLHLIKEEAIKSIGEALGEVEEVELHAKNSPSLEYVIARVWISTEEPLAFKKAARFKTGDKATIITVELDYEKLNRLCLK